MAIGMITDESIYSITSKITTTGKGNHRVATASLVGGVDITQKYFKLLKDSCDVLEDVRLEQNKRLRAHNRQFYITSILLFATVISAISAVLAFF